MFHPSTNRRSFIHQSSGAALALGLGAAVPRCFSHAAESPNKNQDRILVVVQLSGGNDGLNTVVPYTDDAYYAARPNLAIRKADALSIDDSFGFHPSLSGMRELLEGGQLAVVQAVGYDNPNRSHFESMDIWHSCVRKDQPRVDGWLGRYLESRNEAIGGDVPAIHLGYQQQPFALSSESIRVPTVKKLSEFQLRGTKTSALRELLSSRATSPTGNPEATNDLLGFLQSSTQNAISASERVTEATRGYQTDVRYPTSRLAEELKVVAQLIDAGLSTRVYYLQLDGFDTHAQQPDAHAALLRQWSDAVTAFIKDLQSHDHGERVCLMTFSEFGRRVAENASAGTDHGAAGPMFLCGGGLRAGLIGQPPLLSDLQQGDLKHKLDFRSVYASVLEQWLGCDSAAVLGKRYAPLDVFESTNTV